MEKPCLTCEKTAEKQDRCAWRNCGSYKIWFIAEWKKIRRAAAEAGIFDRDSGGGEEKE